MRLKDEWWTAPTESENGRLVMVTGRYDMDEVMSSGKYTDRIEITFPYRADSSGMPSEDDARLLEDVDNALREAFRKEKGCVLTGIYTGDGERNWVVYAKNTNIFGYVINKALSAFPLLPIKLYAEKDPEWNEYREMRELSFIPPGD